MDERDYESFTFRDLWILTKKSFPRMVVYVLVAVILLTSVLFIVQGVGTTEDYRAQVMFSNKGIENGMSPWDTTLDVREKIKNSYIVNAALQDIGISDTAERAKMVPRVLEALSVTAAFNIPKDGDETEPINAFAFNVTLGSAKELGLKKDKARELVDAIVDGFIKDYKSAYSFVNFVDSPDKTLIGSYNYIQRIDILRQNLAQMLNLAQQLSSTAGNFRSTATKMSFGDIALALEQSAGIGLNATESYIYSLGITAANIMGASEKDYLARQIAQLKVEDAVQEKTLKDLQEQATQAAEKLNSSGGITGGTNGTPTVVDDHYYYELVKQVQIASEAYNRTHAQFIVLQENAAVYNANSGFAQMTEDEKAAVRKKADDMTDVIVESLASLGQSLNDTIAEYNDTAVLKNAVYKSATAYAVSSTVLGTKIIILVDAAVLVLAVVAALIVTRRHGAMKLKVGKDNASASSACAEGSEAPVPATTETDTEKDRDPE